MRGAPKPLSLIQPTIIKGHVSIIAVVVQVNSDIIPHRRERRKKKKRVQTTGVQQTGKAYLRSTNAGDQINVEFGCRAMGASDQGGVEPWPSPHSDR
jgi:hypothetical protein